MHHDYTYASVLAASEKVDWKVEDLIDEDSRIDFRRPLLPESLAGSRRLTFLNVDERLVHNQIRGHGYLSTFGLVEEFILPFVLDHVRPHLAEDDHRTRALLTFAQEEAKHIQLFKAFRRAFERDFGSPCEVIGPPEAVAAFVLDQHPLAVALAILHIEWMTQRHFQESVRDDADLDPMFKSLLKHHWMEEAQHAKLDTLMVETLVDAMSPEEIEKGIAGYGVIGAFLDDGLMQQVELDLVSLEQRLGRALRPHERKTFRVVQQDALRWTFLGSGATHPNFVATLDHVRSYGGRTDVHDSPAHPTVRRNGATTASATATAAAPRGYMEP